MHGFVILVALFCLTATPICPPVWMCYFFFFACHVVIVDTMARHISDTRNDILLQIVDVCFSGDLQCVMRGGGMIASENAEIARWAASDREGWRLRWHRGCFRGRVLSLATAESGVESFFSDSQTQA